jgi:hypothetical protein
MDNLLKSGWGICGLTCMAWLIPVAISFYAGRYFGRYGVPRVRLEPGTARRTAKSAPADDRGVINYD